VTNVAARKALSTIRCPRYGHQQAETMPTDACWYLYDCKGCGALLRPLPGDCCVFCSYGGAPCLPVRRGRGDASLSAADGGLA
jgi:hypothetical protein